jgi:hypothetical protein
VGVIESFYPVWVWDDQIKVIGLTREKEGCSRETKERINVGAGVFVCYGRGILVTNPVTSSADLFKLRTEIYRL